MNPFHPHRIIYTPNTSLLSLLLDMYMLYQILNRAHFDAPLFPKSKTIISPHHAAALKRRHALDNLTVSDEFANHTHGFLPSQSAQIHRRLCMSFPLSHTPLSRLQRQYMSRPPKMLRSGVRIR